MTTSEIAEALEAFNSWRRGDDTEQPNPTEIGLLIDAAINLLRELEREVKRLRDLKFPAELRKMWSGSDVQAWLDVNLNAKSV